IQPDARNSVAELDCVRSSNQRGVVAVRQGLIDGMARSRTGDVVDAEVRHQGIAYVRNAQFARPVSTERGYLGFPEAPEEADPRIVDETVREHPRIADG